jgi:hypothetical protein
MRKRRRTDTSLGDFEREEDRAAKTRPRKAEFGVDEPGSPDGREFLVDDEQDLENTDGPQRGTPWGFWLVLAAIVVIAVVYSVTMFRIGEKIATPATALAGMTATFTVIGTLVGTYFGIKAGLDGQDKVKETVTRAVRGDAERQRARSRGAVEGRRDRQRSQDQQRGERERRERGESEGP